MKVVGASAAGVALGDSWQIVEAGEPEENEKQAQGKLPHPSARVQRFESLAFGMFVHWGLYSQLGKGEWAMNMHAIPKDEYLKLMDTFTAEGFRGRDLARAAKQAGMRYITLTSRHHDGFSMYDTRGLSKLDVTNTPCGRDLIADFCDGCREEGIVPMLYCTTLDWSDPRFNDDFDSYLGYLRDSIELLCTNYGEIGGFWFDGNWAKPNADWKEDELYAVIRKHQPQAMIINNVGLNAGGSLGHPEIDSTTFEQHAPKPLDRSGWEKHVAVEMCKTFNRHWGIGELDFNMFSPAHVIELLGVCRGAGSNLLLNVGPGASGRLPDYERAAIARVGDWVRMVGDTQSTIYQGRPCGIRSEGRDFGLAIGELEQAESIDLFVYSLTETAGSWTQESPHGPGARTYSGVPAAFTKATWVDSGESIELSRDERGDLVMQTKKYPYGTDTVVRVARLTRG